VLGDGDKEIIDSNPLT